MSIRHKAFKSTLEKGYASEWNDDHHVDFTDELVFYDVFVYNALAPCWSVAQCAVDGTAAIILVSGHNFAVMTSGTTASSIASMRLGTTDTTSPGDLPSFHVAVQLATVALAEFGFFVAATVPFTANQEGAYFRVSAGVLYAVTSTGAAETATSLGAPDEYAVYWVDINSSDVRFYQDTRSSPLATHTTNLPSSNLTIKLSTKVSGGVSQILRCDGAGLTRLRKA